MPQVLRAYITLTMTKNRLSILTVALGAGALGAASLAGAFLFADLTPLDRAIGVTFGVLGVAGGWFVFRGRRLGVALLWGAAAAYALVNLVPALQRHGTGAFSILMSAFYVSVLIRVGLAAAAHVLLRPPRHG